jgi:hypothetical protein
MATKSKKVNSRQKGKRGERRAVAFLKSRGIDARRTQQHCGAAGNSDVIATDYPKAFIEVKYMDKLPGWQTKMFQRWLEKIREQSPSGGGLLIAFENGTTKPLICLTGWDGWTIRKLEHAELPGILSQLHHQSHTLPVASQSTELTEANQ